MHLKFHFFHFGCCNLPFLHFSFWFLPVKTLKKYSEYSEHLFEYSNIIRLFKMGRIRIRIVLFGKKYSNIRIIRIFVSTLVPITWATVNNKYFNEEPHQVEIIIVKLNLYGRTFEKIFPFQIPLRHRNIIPVTHGFNFINFKGL